MQIIEKARPRGEVTFYKNYFYRAIRNTITCFREAFWITATLMVLGIV